MSDDETQFDLAAVVGVGMRVGSKLDTVLDDVMRDRHKLSRPLMAQSVDSQGWISFPPCPLGKIWHVRRVAVMNGDPWTAGIGGSLAAICVGHSDSGNVKLTEIRQPGTQIPFIATFGFDECPVKSGEEVYVIVHSGSLKEIATVDIAELDV